jgi:membrane-associated phospholipid phosphatase
MFSQLESIDKQIFLWINQQSTNSFFDAIMPFMRNSTNWIPLYVLMILLAIKQEQKKVWLWLLFALTTIFVTDQVSSHIIKPLIQRIRPCADPNFKNEIRLLVSNCSQGFSFTSSHATNHFGIAVFFMFSLKSTLKNWKFIFPFWAATIAFAQVYVGVHYPFDVFFGSLLGIILGYLVITIYRKIYNKKFATTNL